MHWKNVIWTTINAFVIPIDTEGCRMSRTLWNNEQKKKSDDEKINCILSVADRMKKKSMKISPLASPTHSFISELSCRVLSSCQQSVRDKSSNNINKKIGVVTFNLLWENKTEP